MRPAHLIVIADEVLSNGFEVVVRPPPDGIGHDSHFARRSAADRYACRLSSATGWPVVDLARPA